MTFQAKIEKNVVQNMPVTQTNCEIVVVDKKEDVEKAVEHLKKCHILGFDTETKPSFYKGSRRPIALIQIASADKCFLFRINKIGMHKKIVELLEDPNIKKVGIGLKNDFTLLQKTLKFSPYNFVDLQRIAIAFGIEELGLQKMYAIVFGEKISKKQQLSNWEADSLNKAQQMYAATDAWACRELYLRFMGDINQ